MIFAAELRRQSLALVSLAVALSALGYTTWRNEVPEHNRNLRQAGFEKLVHIGELQRVAYLAHFDGDLEAGNPRKGWVEVFVLRDLANIMPTSAQTHAAELFAIWRDRSPQLGSDDEAVALIDRAINDLRSDVVAVLSSLD